MVRTAVIRAARMAQRSVLNASAARLSTKVTSSAIRVAGVHSPRAFSRKSAAFKGMMPESSDPAPRNVEPESHATAPTEITDKEYHEAADSYIGQLVQTLEDLAEADELVDVEHSAGIVTVVVPPIGTYVINKQPPNKQIWLSSPISGPKRFDWVMLGEAQNQKEGGGKGEWIYLRDGTSLTQLLESELKFDLTKVQL